MLLHSHLLYIKVANLQMEYAYLNDNIFDKLSDKDRTSFFVGAAFSVWISLFSTVSSSTGRLLHGKDHERWFFYRVIDTLNGKKWNICNNLPVELDRNCLPNSYYNKISHKNLQ